MTLSPLVEPSASGWGGLNPVVCLKSREDLIAPGGQAEGIQSCATAPRIASLYGAFTDCHASPFVPPGFSLRSFFRETSKRPRRKRRQFLPGELYGRRSDPSSKYISAPCFRQRLHARAPAGTFFLTSPSRWVVILQRDNGLK